MNLQEQNGYKSLTPLSLSVDNNDPERIYP